MTWPQGDTKNCTLCSHSQLPGEACIPEKQNNAVLEKDDVEEGVSIYLQLLIEQIEFKYNLSNNKWKIKWCKTKQEEKKKSSIQVHGKKFGTQPSLIHVLSGSCKLFQLC